MSTTKKNLVIDVIALVVYLVVATPALTGIVVHEWLSIGLFLAFLFHTAMHADWAVEALRNLKLATWSTRGNLVLGVAILLAFVVVMVSGLGISGALLQTFGLYAEGYFFWDPLHAIAAKVLLALLLLHVVVHAKWLYHCLKKERFDKDGLEGE